MEALAIPKGFRIDRDEGRLDSPLTPEIAFRVIETEGGDDELTAVSVYLSRGDGWWYIRPGSQTRRLEADEARARAAALIMAADEQDKLNPNLADA